MAEVRLDADGKPLSKNALKKLLKAEKAAAAKAEKAKKKVREDVSRLVNVVSMPLTCTLARATCICHCAVSGTSCDMICISRFSSVSTNINIYSIVGRRSCS